MSFTLVFFIVTMIAQIAVSKESIEPEIVWTYKSGGPIWSSSTTNNQVTYIGSTDNCLYALKTKSGEQLWRFQTGGPIYSKPKISGGYLYLTSDDGFLYKLSLTGKQIWKFNMQRNEVRTRVLPGPNPGFDFFSSAPAIADGVVFAGSADGHFYSVNADTGELKWQFETDGIVRSTPSLADGKVIFGSFDGRIYALSQNSGKEIWRFDATKVVNSVPLISDGVVYIGSRNTQFYALNLENGAVIWSKPYGNGSFVEASAALSKGTLYIGSSFWARALAIEPKTGASIWEARVRGGCYSLPLLTDKAYYTGTAGFANQPQLQGAVIRLDRETGKEVWRLPFARIENQWTHGVTGSPELVDGLLLFGALDGTFYAVREKVVQHTIIAYRASKTQLASKEKSMLLWETVEGSTVLLNDLPVAVPKGSRTATIVADTSFTLTAKKGKIVESQSIDIRVLPIPDVNRAHQQPAFSSSGEPDPDVADPGRAFDGDPDTRWSSAWADSQWIYVDLGETYAIERVVLDWESAFGKSYVIEVSDDAKAWTEIFRETNGDGGQDQLIDLRGSGRFVRMFGLSRATPYGFSLYEFSVYQFPPEK